MLDLVGQDGRGFTNLAPYVCLDGLGYACECLSRKECAMTTTTGIQAGFGIGIDMNG